MTGHLETGTCSRESSGHGWECPLSGANGKHILVLRITGYDPKPTSAVRPHWGGGLFDVAQFIADVSASGIAEWSRWDQPPVSPNDGCSLPPNPRSRSSGER
jgi:hypothetical protein